MSTSTPSRFLLDANVFIEARKRYYAFDICPAFWHSIVQEHNKGHLWSIDKVDGELKDADLRSWIATDLPPACWMSTGNSEVAVSYGSIISWVQSSDFTQAAKDEFARVADGWLIAYAYANGHTLVTEEKHIPNRKNRVMIPNVCMKFGIPCIDTFDMLRALGCKFKP